MKYVNNNKLKKIELEEDNYYVIVDFDKTITSNTSLDSWMAIIDFNIYGESCKKEIETLNNQYVPFELDYTLDKKTKEKYMIQWYQKSMDLLYKYQITNSNLKKAIRK